MQNIDSAIPLNFKVLAETLPQMVWVSEPDGTYEYCNKKWYAFLNVTPKQNTRENWSQSIHPEDREKVLQLWNHSVLTGDQYETEYRLLDGQTGEYRWLLARASAIKDDQGKVQKWCGTCTDIHEQKIITEAQTFLAEASKVLSSSLNYLVTLDQVASLASTYISDWCTVELFENNTIKQIAVSHKEPEKVKLAKKLSLGRTINMEENQGMVKVVKTGKSEFYPVITDDMLKNAARDKAHLKLIRSLGFISVMIVPITIEQKTIGVIQFVSSESKKRFSKFDLYTAEELGRRAALAIQNAQLYEDAQQKEKQFKALYDSNIIGVIYTNLSGKIINANDAFLQIIGYTREDLNNNKLNWEKLTPPEYRKQNQQAIKDILTNGVVSPWEKEYFKKDGSQVPVIIGSVLVNKSKTQILTFILDITERKKLEQRKDEFIGIASHELKTPLTSIKGYVQILERIVQQMGDEKLDSYIQKTNTYINRLNSLIVDLLDVSKIQSGKLSLNFSDFTIKELVNEVIENIQQTNKSYKIILTGNDNILINADKHRLEQVFINLTSNAIKYSPRTKKIVIGIDQVGKNVQVSIQDFGIGITKKEQTKIFDRFYRAEAVTKRFSGLGIGLYISCEIVGRHGGKMWVKSEPGKGSTFFFTIPINRKAT